MAMPSIESRILASIADVIQEEDAQEVVESVRIFLDLPKMVPEKRLTSTHVSRQHFLQWDPQVFVPGKIWDTVTFPQDITNSKIYLFTAVLFSRDDRMRVGEPRVWKELCTAWDATFGLAPGELRPNVEERRYGSLCQVVDTTHRWPEQPLDYAISGECHLHTRGEDSWLRDCLYHYDPPDSLEKLSDLRSSMVTEGPRWWRTPENGEIKWMPKRFWGANAGRWPRR